MAARVLDESAIYTFTHRAVTDNAPKASGVYCIFTAKRWVHLGESDDVRQSLFDHLNDPAVCLQESEPLSFSFALLPAAERSAALAELMAARPPACTPEP